MNIFVRPGVFEEEKKMVLGYRIEPENPLENIFENRQRSSKSLKTSDRSGFISTEILSPRCSEADGIRSRETFNCRKRNPILK